MIATESIERILRPRVLVAGLTLTGLMLGAQAASAQSCIQEAAGRSLVCTANDVRVAYADNIRDTSGEALSQCVRGSTFSFIADFHVQTTATSRYDIGLYFATDGDPNGNGARSGVCSANDIRDRYLDPAAPSAVMLGSDLAANLDGDSCRDINTANGWGETGGQIVTVRVDNVQCQDSDNDGRLNLPNCTSWSQNTGGECNTPADTAPGSPSKCNCDIGFNVPIFVETGSIQVTKDASPTSLPEPGGDFVFTVGVYNTAQFTSLTLDRICDDQYGLVAKVSGAPDCPPGTSGTTISGTTCTLPQSLDPDDGVTGSGLDQYSCAFTVNVTSSTATTITDVVTVFGHDQNNVALQGSDSATIAITDVPPSANVVKSLVGLACADVHYRVRVNNNNSSESLTLSSLIDSGFGSVTTVQGNVLATNCSVPQTIAIGGNYECDFTAHFCGGSHTNTVTATLSDDDNSSITPTSNSLTVNVSAQ